MKYVLELILITIVIFFVWNILKRLFLNTFYRFPQQNTPPKNPPKEKKNSSGLNWDAETIDYEEVKEEEEQKN
ncbi:hypothetical protein [Daejeonia sp. YH14]|uniref:hypothetical protein n=1 Tax=Daejeonia sp. YH14 TaxID=3439042 RepID=UPI003F49A97E